MIFTYFTNPFQLYSDIVPGIAEGFLCVVGIVCAILLALSVHEMAHALIASKCGDNTAKQFGRITINPLKHLDIVGGMMLLFFGFGWAKPVPVNSGNFNHYKRGMVAVSLAGILTNLLAAFIFTGVSGLLYLLAGLSAIHDSLILYFLVYLFYVFAQFFVIINISLALFNILPFYPLDGYRLLETFVKSDNRIMTYIRQYSMFVVLGLLLLGSIFPQYSPLNLYIQYGREFIMKGFNLFWNLFGLVGVL